MGELRRIQREKKYEGGIVDLYQDTVVLPTGKIEKWDYVHHKKGAGACIVPVTREGEIIMIRQRRPVFSEEPVLELPAGARNHEGEDLAETALRELEEETGCTCSGLQKLVRVCTAVAYCNEYTDIFLAEPAVPCGGQRLDEAEDLQIERHSLESLLEKIFKGEITDGKTVAGLLAYSTWKRQPR